ncbi:hypothetical protein Hte_001687 [Hypoxylon texense]
MSAFSSRHEASEISTPLYLTNITEKEIQVMVTRSDGSKLSATAKPTSHVRFIFIPQRMAKQLGLKIRPVAKKKRKQYLTPNGRQNPVGFVEFDIESEANDIHPTHVSAMVLNDSHDDLKAICLGVKFFEKAFGAKFLKTRGLSEIPKNTVGSNSMASYTVAAVNTAGNVHHPYENPRDMGRLATATEPQPFISSSPISPVPTNTQSFLYPSTGSYPRGYSCSGYPSSGAFSEPSATTGITAPSSVEGGSDKPHTSVLHTGQLGPPSNGTINPLMLTSDNGNGSSSTNGSFYTAWQLPSGQDDPYDYSHPQSGTNIPYIRLN